MMRQVPKWDLAVIGGGPGGVAAAIRSSQLGARVVLMEAGQLGGNCVNRGCVPTEVLMRAARLVRAMQRAGDLGLKVQEASVDWAALMRRKQHTIEDLRSGTEALLRSNRVEIIKGMAAFSGPHTLQVAGEALQADAIIIATGFQWCAPRVPGMETPGVINTDHALSMREIPSALAVWGSGFVELEMAQYFLFMGARVTLLEEASRILPNADREVSMRLARILKTQGMDIMNHVTLQEITQHGDGLRIRLGRADGPEELLAQRLLHAGRCPRSKELGLEAAGLEASPGGIAVDTTLRTSVPHIFAVGDVTGEPMYSHRAAAMGMAAAQAALGAESRARPEIMPMAVYTAPEVAWVGLTEREAKHRGYRVTAVRIPYGTNGKALIMSETQGAVKVVADQDSGEILGIHILGPQATELISEGVLAMELGATAEDLARAVRLHPTLAETQVDAARELLGRGIYVMR